MGKEGGRIRWGSKVKVDVISTSSDFLPESSSEKEHVQYPKINYTVCVCVCV